MCYGVKPCRSICQLRRYPMRLRRNSANGQKRHHRSLQGELIVILEKAAGPETISLEEAERRLSALNFKTGDDSAAWIRELRDGS